MPSETRCDCCDLPTAMCGKASEQRIWREERARLNQLLRTPPWFAAIYTGVCGSCNERFPVGYPIRAILGKGYIGACCSG